MNTIAFASRVALCAMVGLLLTAGASAIDYVDATTPAYICTTLGDFGAPSAVLPWFPAPHSFGGTQNEVFDTAPDMTMTAAAAMGDWLTDPAHLNANWSAPQVPPWFWGVNDEIALVYEIDAGAGISGLVAQFDLIDNGIHIWVNGEWKFGARDPEGRGWADIVLGDLAPGTNYIQILLEDSGGATRYVEPLLTVNTDVDEDGVTNSEDNCIYVSNPDQLDSNGDNIGNACDADLNNDCNVNAIDLGELKLVFFTGDADADFNGDGIVNAIDLGVMKIGFFAAPGPSGLTNDCE